MKTLGKETRSNLHFSLFVNGIVKLYSYTSFRRYILFCLHRRAFLLSGRTTLPLTPIIYSWWAYGALCSWATEMVRDPLPLADSPVAHLSSSRPHLGLYFASLLGWLWLGFYHLQRRESWLLSLLIKPSRTEVEKRSHRRVLVMRCLYGLPGS